MAEQSQLSHYSGVSQVSQFGGSQVSAISSGDDRDSPTVSAGLLAATFIVIFVVCFGVFLSFIMGDAKEPEDVDDDMGSSGGIGGGGPIGGGGVLGRSPGGTIYRRAGTTNPPLPTILPVIPVPMTSPPVSMPTLATIPTTTTTRRPGMVICVVGESFVNPKLFDGNWCDYAIYPDLVKGTNSFTSLYGPTSWDAFQMAVAAHPQMGVGVSFSLRNSRDTSSTVASIPRLLPMLHDLSHRLNVSAMGVLNFPRHEGVNTTELALMFETLWNAVRQQNHAQPMVFLGVELYTAQAVDDFVSEVVSIGSITTIIIQTHLHSYKRLGAPTVDECTTFPVSDKYYTTPLPSFLIAEQAEQRLRSQGDKFRIMFSSTMGVALFVGAAGSGKPTKVFDECESALMTDYNTLCNSTGYHLHQTVEDREEYGYVTWVDGARNYWANYETESGLKLKLDRHVSNASDGWAIFEAQRDVWKGCNQSNYLRVEMIQDKARRRMP